MFFPCTKFKNLPPTTPEMMIKIDRLSKCRKKERIIGLNRSYLCIVLKSVEEISFWYLDLTVMVSQELVLPRIIWLMNKWAEFCESCILNILFRLDKELINKVLVTLNKMFKFTVGLEL